jgi:hypothetical protein
VRFTPGSEPLAGAWTLGYGRTGSGARPGTGDIVTRVGDETGCGAQPAEDGRILPMYLVVFI